MEVFDFKAYKPYLLQRLNDRSAGGGRGSRARLSRSIGCQTAYTAQVLRGRAHFSLEQGEAINDFLGHTPEQGRFFLLLIQKERAGTVKLRRRFEEEIESVLSARLALKNRLGVSQALSERSQATYYSAWFYAAIHALASIPGFQSPEKIARRLGIGLQKANSALEFLLAAGLLKKDEKGALRIGLARLHLPHDSPLISKHHANWRLQAMRALEQEKEESLHYSSVVSLSREDAKRIRELLVNALATIKPIVRDSREEELHCLSLDFFEV